MKNIPNIITGVRILLSIILFFIEPFSFEFYAMYIGCGSSDILDGYIARKANVTSLLGSKLDTIADFTMIVVLFIKLYPIVEIPNLIVKWIFVIAMVRLLSLFIVFIKFHTFAILHTYANKGTGLILFFVPLCYSFINTSVLAYFICIFASVSSIEEFFIHLNSKELNNDRISIFK